MGRPLSRLQQGILLSVWRRRQDNDPEVTWHWLLPRDPSPAESAAWSRSLRRLEERGLLERLGKQGGPRWGRTRLVRLTPQGWQAAAALRPDLDLVIRVWEGLSGPVKAEIAGLAARGLPEAALTPSAAKT